MSETNQTDERPRFFARPLPGGGAEILDRRSGMAPLVRVAVFDADKYRPDEPVQRAACAAESLSKAFPGYVPPPLPKEPAGAAACGEHTQGMHGACAGQTQAAPAGRPKGKPWTASRPLLPGWDDMDPLDRAAFLAGKDKQHDSEAVQAQGKLI